MKEKRHEIICDLHFVNQSNCAKVSYVCQITLQGFEEGWIQLFPPKQKWGSWLYSFAGLSCLLQYMFDSCQIEL